MFHFYKSKYFCPQKEYFFSSIHPMACVEFMRQDVSLPIKKGKKIIQRLKNNQAYVRDIVYLSKERSFYGTN